jgi:hypothetical protein
MTARRKAHRRALQLSEWIERNIRRLPETVERVNRAAMRHIS